MTIVYFSLGYYQDTEGSTSCKQCAEGEYSDVTASPTCTDCPAGECSLVFPLCVCVPSGSSPVCGLLFVIVMQLAGIVQGMLQIFNTIKPPYTGTISTAQGSTQCSQCPAGTTSLPG